MVTDQRRPVVHRSLPGSKFWGQIMKLSVGTDIMPAAVAAGCSCYQLPASRFGSLDHARRRMVFLRLYYSTVVGL